LKSRSSRPETTKADARSIEKEAAPSSARVAEPSTVSDVRRPREPEPALEDDEIERHIVKAELAGRVTVADALARQLDARRGARAGKVVDLDAVRARQGTAR
jgi:hypothetical protein